MRFESASAVISVSAFTLATALVMTVLAIRRWLHELRHTTAAAPQEGGDGLARRREDITAMPDLLSKPEPDTPHSQSAPAEVGSHTEGEGRQRRHLDPLFVLDSPGVLALRRFLAEQGRFKEIQRLEVAAGISHDPSAMIHLANLLHGGQASQDSHLARQRMQQIIEEIEIKLHHHRRHGWRWYDSLLWEADNPIVSYSYPEENLRSSADDLLIRPIPPQFPTRYWVLLVDTVRLAAGFKAEDFGTVGKMEEADSEATQPTRTAQE